MWDEAKARTVQLLLEREDFTPDEARKIDADFVVRKNQAKSTNLSTGFNSMRRGCPLNLIERNRHEIGAEHSKTNPRSLGDAGRRRDRRAD
jgi:hypothetical protein